MTQRQSFLQASDPPAQAAHARDTLRLLLAQDGSTTRLCETVAGGPITVHVLEQQVVQEVPAEVRAALPGRDFIERITFLAAHGQVMMDNLSYIALEGLAPDIRRDLEAGTMPIGHLLARMWVRREFLAPAAGLCERLWGACGEPDVAASRTYRIVTPEGPRMLIAETYRRGMLM
ncbi:MAG: chorismate pyruvate-lyase family protein [Pseudomonadota bacterium]